MNNRKLRNLRPGMSLAALRELALGEDLVQWSAEVEPKLRKQCEDMISQTSVLITETQRDLLEMELMESTDGGKVEKLRLEIRKLQLISTPEAPKDAEIARLEIDLEFEKAKSETRKAEITRLTIQDERQTSILKSQTEIYQKLSAGGGASVWAALQRLTPPQAPQREEERDAGPKRHFRSVKATEVEAQVVDSE